MTLIAVLDLPSAFYPAELLAAYPAAKFIATHRDATGWFKSISALVGTVNALRHPTIRRLHQTVYGSELPNERIWIAHYNAHYLKVEATIPQSQLLMMELADLKRSDYHPYAEVCRLLGMASDECPSSSWPRSNSIESIKANPFRNKLLAQQTEATSGAVLATGLLRYAYATLLSGVSESHVLGAGFLTASLVWCQSVRDTYASNGGNDASPPYEMVLLTLDTDLSSSQLASIDRCFDRVVPVRPLGLAPRGQPDNHFWETLRSKWWTFSLTEYERVIFMDADQVRTQAHRLTSS